MVDVNRAALLHYGYSRDEFLALTVDALSVESARPRQGRRRTRTQSARHRRKDGSCIDVEVTSFPVTFGGDRLRWPPSWTSRTAGATEAQTRYLDLLLATVNDAVVASDEQFVLTGWNAAAESTYGETRRGGARPTGCSGVPHRLRRRRADRSDQAAA